jgi:hypothetical protein
VFTKNLTNPAYEVFRIAADQVARSAGARIVHFVPKQPDNVAEQQTMVEQVLKDRPDAVVFIPIDDVAMIGSAKKLNEATIPVVLASNPLPGQFVTYIGADDFAIGYQQARYLFDKLGGKGKIVVIEGIPVAPTNRERVRGYKRAIAEFPGIEVLDSGIGNYQQPDARRVMEEFPQKYPEIDAVLSANDGMALGALEALAQAKRTSVVIGINGILPAVKQRDRRAARQRRFQHVQDRLHRDARGAAPSQGRATAGKDPSARPRSSTSSTTRPGSPRWTSAAVWNGARSRSKWIVAGHALSPHLHPGERKGPVRRVACCKRSCSMPFASLLGAVIMAAGSEAVTTPQYKSLSRNADGAVLTALAPGSQTDFFEKWPLALVDAREQIDPGFAAPVAHRLGAVKPSDRLEAGDVAVRPFAGVDDVAEPSIEYLVLARRLVRQIELGVGFAAGPSRVVGLDG